MYHTSRALAPNPRFLWDVEKWLTRSYVKYFFWSCILILEQPCTLISLINVEGGINVEVGIVLKINKRWGRKTYLINVEGATYLLYCSYQTLFSGFQNFECIFTFTMYNMYKTICFIASNENAHSEKFWANCSTHRLIFSTAAWLQMQCTKSFHCNAPIIWIYIVQLI